MITAHEQEIPGWQSTVQPKIRQMIPVLVFTLLNDCMSIVNYYPRVL